MKQSKTEPLGQAVTLHTLPDTRFKTMRLSVDLLLPLAQQTAARYGILPGIITRATKSHPTFLQLNQKLSDLYGASLSTAVRKMGAFQVLRLTASGISGQYAFGGEPMTEELLSLLTESITSPLTDSDGLFPAEHFAQEQRQLLELKDSEFSDKIAYARHRCEKLLLAGSEGAIDRHGERDEIAAMRREDLVGVWQNALSSARMEVFALGAYDEAALKCRLSPLSNLGQSRQLSLLPFSKPAEPVREIEEQSLAQSKLSMGFRVDCAPQERLLFQLMSAVFGGVPSSKLFQNVREKMGLCYYCSSSYSHLSRAMYVDSGVETENIEKAEEQILLQLSALQNGELTDSELLSAKLALCNSLHSVGDSLGAVESWHMGNLFEMEFTPQQAAERMMQFTKEEVVQAAQRVYPGAVFALKGTEGH